MSGVKHTPGPWRYYPANNYCGFAIVTRGALPTLAAVERPRGNANTLNVTAFNLPGETEANARLIAAAPDLLEALESIVLMQEENRGDGIKTHMALSNLCMTARAAIARARGES